MSVQDNVLGAMDIIASSMVSNLKLDKTVQAVVQEVVNMTTGEYRVEYNGNVVTAFALNTDDTYSVNEKVFLKIPENDMNNKKFIEGRASSSSLSDLQQTELSNSISKEGPSWELIYPTLDLNNTEQKYCIQAGASQDEEYYSRVIWDRDINSLENIELSDEIFLTYSQNYDKIYVGADFQTTFIDQELVGQGNYGLIFTFIARQQSENVENEFTEDQEVSYRLDINSFTGNPYGYTVFSPQETILDLKSNYLLKLKSIILFQENFTGKDSVDVPNICVRNIKMQFARIEDLSDTLYYLKILTPDGVNLMSDNDEITLMANFLYKGQNILSEKTCKCDWYILDPSVVVGTEFYEKEIGPGWKKLEENSTFGQYIVKGIDVLSSNRYMCKITYNNNLVMEEEIDIIKYYSTYKVALEQSMDGKEAILSIVNLNEDERTYVGDWYYEYGDGTFSSIIDGEDVDKIYINRYLSYATVTFYCQVKTDNQNICVLSKVITSSNVDSELVIEYEGQDVFNYTADGDMPVENCEKDQTLYPKLSWRDGYASTYKIQWEIGGKILNTTEKYNPTQSMTQEMWVDTNGVLHFKVKQKYYRLYTNNTLTLRIITVDGKEFVEQKEILFVKMGDQGTNGTTFISAVRPVDMNGNKLSGFQAINAISSNSTMRLRNFIYKDGDLINNNSKYDITYTWSCDGTRNQIKGIDKTTVSKNDGTVDIIHGYAEKIDQTSFIITPSNSNVDTVTISYNGIQNYDRLIIKCDVEIITKTLFVDYDEQELTEQDKQKNEVVREKTILHYNFPVPLITSLSGEFKSEDFDIEIPEYIQYDANGQTALYLDDFISFGYKGKDYTSLSNIVSGNEEILKVKSYTDSDGKAGLRLVAAGTYDYYNNGNAYLTLKADGVTVVFPIMMYLNTYGNQAINNWDGTNIAIYNAENGTAGYILAPQIGAGTKDADGRFTGVVMGDDTTQSVEQKKVPGLYGYQAGVNTFGIKSDGTMYLGKSVETGRIDFDGNRGIIYGGGKGEEKTGMTIKLTNLIDDDGDPIQSEEERDEVLAIQVAQDNFKVTYGGSLTANRGSVGGWTINEWGLFSPDTRMNDVNGYPAEENSGRLMLWAKNPYDPNYVENSDGNDETALLVANQAKIGGWIIKPSGIFSPDTEFGTEANSAEYVPMPGESQRDQVISKDGVIMLISKSGDTEDRKGYASIGGWIVKEDVITSQIEVTHANEWSNTNPDDGMANTRLVSDKGIIHTSYFNVVAPNSADPNGTEIGRMGFITGNVETPTGEIVQSINLGIQTGDLDTSSIVMKANNTFTVSSGNGFIVNTSNYAAFKMSQGAFSVNCENGGITLNSTGTTEISSKEKIRISKTNGNSDSSQHMAIYFSSDNLQMRTKNSSISLYENGEIRFHNSAGPSGQHGIYCRFA